MLYPISYKENPFYCIDLTETLPALIKSNEKINHIVIVDNANILDKCILNSIKTTYPHMLSSYTKIASLEHVHLITTYPKLKYVTISRDVVYSEFSKISFNNNGNSSKINKTLDEGIKYICPDIINEIVMFTHFSSQPKPEVLNLLNILKDHTFSIINDNLINLDPFISYVLTCPEEYSKLITSKIFCHIQDTNFTINSMKILNGNIYGTNINEITFSNTYNFIPITEKIDSIILNDKEHALTFMETTISDNNMIEMIECILYNGTNINSTINSFKDILLFFERSNPEIRWRSMAVYIQYKNLYDKIIGDVIQKININDDVVNKNKNSEELKNIEINIQNSNNDNISVIIEYGKKSGIPNVKNFKIPQFNTINIDKFIQCHDNNKEIEFINSLDFFESQITLSNWYDEIKNNCAMGVLFTSFASELTKKGVHGFGNITDVTSTFMPIIDFISNANEYFTKNTQQYGDLNNTSIVMDSLIGSANSVLPIYIHKQHWIIAKTYLQPLLGILHSHSPFTYKKSYENIYHNIFIHMTHSLFNENKQYLNDKFVKLYFSIFRTCAEICFENKYNFGIKNLMNSYMSNPLNRMSKSYLDYNKLFTQILTTGYNISNLGTLLMHLLEESIRLCVRKEKYTNAYFYEINNYIDDNEKRHEEFDKLMENICELLQPTFETFIAYYKITSIFKEMVKKCGTYGQFIKQLDKNYGILSNELTELVIKSITHNNENITFEMFHNTVCQGPYNKNKIIMYILQGITCSKNNAMVNRINDGNYIDILNTDVTDEIIVNYVKL